MRRSWLPAQDDERGQSMVLLALVFVLLLAFTGLALDAGQYYRQEDAAQTVADAAALAGASALPTSPAVALDRARGVIQANGMDPGQFTITTAYRSQPDLIRVLAQQEMQTAFMRVVGVDQLPVTASAVARSAPPHAFDFALFSGSPTRTLQLGGSNTVNGGTHGNASIEVLGTNHLGAVEAVGTTMLTGANHTGQISNGVPTVPMPGLDFATLAQHATSVYSGNQTFSGNTGLSGTVVVHGDVTLTGDLTFAGILLVDGNVTVTGNTSHIFSGQAAVVAKGDIRVEGNTRVTYDQARAAGGTSALALVSSAGNILIGGNAEIDGVIYAPAQTPGAGTITLEGNADINGAVIGNVVTANGDVEIGYDQGALTAVPPTIGDRGRLIE